METVQRADGPVDHEPIGGRNAMTHVLKATLSDSAFYQQPGSDFKATLARLEAITKELAVCYARWETLEAQATATG